MEKKESMHKFLIGLCIIVIDQLSKNWVEKNIPFTEYLEINNFFKIVHFQNTGAAFSFLDSASGWQNNFFIFLTLAILIYLFYLYRQNTSSPYGSISIMMIISGAIGNLIDRVSNGHVTDFIYVHINDYYWPAFNVADSVITIGAIIYFLGLLKGKIK